jgi:hypothetical protein
MNISVEIPVLPASGICGLADVFFSVHACTLSSPALQAEQAMDRLFISRTRADGSAGK